jgi:hypothetical protein
MSWKFTDATRRVVWRTVGQQLESRLFEALTPEEQAACLDPDPPPPPTQDELDAAEARQYAKLQALRAMTPAQVDAWVDANVSDLASARDALKTLAIAVGILARRL